MKKKNVAKIGINQALNVFSYMKIVKIFNDVDDSNGYEFKKLTLHMTYFTITELHLQRRTMYTLGHHVLTATATYLNSISGKCPMYNV